MIWFILVALIRANPGIAERVAQCHNDPHCTSFDGKAIEYHGTCDVVLMDECGGSQWLGTDLQIIGRVHSCRDRNNPLGSAPTCVQEIAAVVGGVPYRLVLDDNVTPQFQVDEARHDITGDKDWLLTVDHMIGFAYRQSEGIASTMVLVIESPTNQNEYIQLQLSTRAFLVTISTGLEQKLQGKTCGLFGNMNNDPADDELDAKHVKVGGCRGITPNGRKKRTARFEFCETESAEAEAIKECAIINEQDGPFKDCYQKNTQRDQMFRNCVNDVCVDKKYKCASIEGYARSCSILGVCNGDWRKETGCEMQCPKGMTYSTTFFQERNPTCLHRHVNKCVARSRQMEGEARSVSGLVVEACVKGQIDNVVRKGLQICLDGCACPGSQIWDPSIGSCVDKANCKDPFERINRLRNRIRGRFGARRTETTTVSEPIVIPQ